MCYKVRLSLIVVKTSHRLHYYGYRSSHKPHCLFYLLKLLRLIFKAYKDLTLFHVFLVYVPVVRVEAEPIDRG